MTSAPLLQPPDYNRYFLLYLVATKSTIDMVLLQEDDLLKEHIIYYLSQGLVGPKLNYPHVKKIILEVIHDVQWFCHYIFLLKTNVIVIVNAFQYVLTRRVIGKNISRWIVIL
jgi:hypothetical protein